MIGGIKACLAVHLISERCRHRDARSLRSIGSDAHAISGPKATLLIDRRSLRGSTAGPDAAMLPRQPYPHMSLRTDSELASRDHLDDAAQQRQETTQAPTVISDVGTLTVWATSGLSHLVVCCAAQSCANPKADIGRYEICSPVHGLRRPSGSHGPTKLAS